MAEIRGFSSDELEEKMETMRRSVFDTRFHSATEPIVNGAELNQTRKDIARIMTVLRARELGNEPKPGQQAADGGS